MNKVKAYGFCDAGCKRRVTPYEEFERAAAYIEHHIDEDGTATLNPLAKYQITANPKFENIETVANFPEDIKSLKAYATATIGDDLFLIGGYNSNSIYKYNTKTKVFVKCFAVLPYAITFHSAEAVGSKIYIFGGFEGSGYSEKIFIYDGENDTIVESARTLKKSSISTVAIKDSIYIFGGSESNSSLTNTVYIYDTQADTLNTCGTLPDKIDRSSAAAVGSKIYVVGGSTVSDVDEIYCYDTTTNTSTSIKATFPNVWYGMGAVAFGTKVYIFGGNYSATASHGNKNIYIFDTETKTLTTSGTTVSRGACGTYAEIIGTDMFILEEEMSLNTIQRYNPATYDCLVELKIEQTGKPAKFIFGIDGDAYRNRFNFEVVAIANENGNTKLVYEVNSERHSVEFAGESDGENSVLTTRGATEILQHNDDSRIATDISAEYEAKLGDIETALVSIIAIEDELISRGNLVEIPDGDFEEVFPV